MTKKEQSNKKETPSEKPASGPLSKKAKIALNVGSAVLLLIIAGGIYLYQKGHLDILFHPHPPVAPAVEVKTAEKPPAEEPQLKTLEHTLGALQNRISTLETTVSGQDTHLVKQVFLFQQLKDKIDQGLPFEPELAALKAEIKEEALTTILEAHAHTGISALSQLIADFQTLKSTILSQGALSQATTFWEKVKARLFQLIHVESLDQKENPFSGLTDLLRRGQVDEVLGKTSFLKEDEAVKNWRGQADAYVKVHAVVGHLKQKLLE